MDIKWLVLACALYVGTTSAQRLVTVQPGPLVRTEGSHVTVWCNVSGYREGVEQDFEWSMYLHTAPDREIRMVSTAQQNYAYAVYAQRVNNKEIYVERLGRDSALLHITKVQASDQGVFECYTPNTDGQYLGSYSARTNLTVIPDTLSVTSVAQSLSTVEGDTLQLSCEVTHKTTQHTHLAVGWYLRPAEEPSGTPRDLVTLSREFVLRPGGSYRQRLASGDLRLDKTSASTYRLTIYKLQPADQGQFYCEASEWIQDPDRSWYAMTRKQSDKTTVKVQPTESHPLFGVRRSYEARRVRRGRCELGRTGRRSRNQGSSRQPSPTHQQEAEPTGGLDKQEAELPLGLGKQEAEPTGGLDDQGAELPGVLDKQKAEPTGGLDEKGAEPTGGLNMWNEDEGRSCPGDLEMSSPYWGCRNDAARTMWNSNGTLLAL
ncbi:immunoglobulin superfamily member 3-like [Brachyhypopomus gauderio]|uniref:immunoglobulin superfamily member 3-like n=1 Tax=Brachyhypopomus gauderio TaxID=698409 RepID=UPI00404116BC